MYSTSQPARSPPGRSPRGHRCGGWVARRQLVSGVNRGRPRVVAQVLGGDRHPERAGSSDSFAVTFAATRVRLAPLQRPETPALFFFLRVYIGPDDRKRVVGSVSVIHRRSGPA